MPGLTLRWSPAASTDAARRSYLKGIRSVTRQGYEARTLYDNGLLRVDFTAYSGYPLQEHRTDAFDVYIEGHLSTDGDSLVRTLLRPVLESPLFPPKGRPDDYAELRGDFVVLLIDRKSGGFVLYNDSLGRLPIYYSENGAEVVLSREPSAAAIAGGLHSLEPLAAGQYLLFGFCLGDHSPLKGLSRVRPDAWVAGDPRTGLIRRGNGYPRNFSVRPHSARSIRQNAEALGERMLAATRDQAADVPVLSLSGGLDSRTVGGALAALGIRARLATYVDDRSGTQRDAAIAERMAAILDMEWSRFHLPRVCAADYHELLRCRLGLNPLWMSFILPFVRWKRATYGSEAHQLTGDGGDKAMPALSPSRPLRDDRQLFDYLVERYAIFSLSSAAAIAGIRQSDLAQSVVAHVAGFPEASARDRFVHFLIYERMINQNFEGEERERCFYWSSSPFFDQRFFDYAMACPESQKRYHRLYAGLISVLSPRLASVPRPAVGGAITSPGYRVLRRGQRALARVPFLDRLVHNARTRRSAERPDYGRIETLRRQIAGSNAVEAAFGGRLVDVLDGRREPITSRRADHLLSLTSAVEWLVDGNITSVLDGDEGPARAGPRHRVNGVTS